MTPPTHTHTPHPKFGGMWRRPLQKNCTRWHKQTDRQTDKHTDGDGDSITDPAQSTEPVKNILKKRKKTIFNLVVKKYRGIKIPGEIHLFCILLASQCLNTVEIFPFKICRKSNGSLWTVFYLENAFQFWFLTQYAPKCATNLCNFTENM